MHEPMEALEQLMHRLQTQAAVLVSIQSSQGSVPREVGAWMAVFPDVACNTLGGGHFEFEAIAQARQWLTQGRQSPPAAWRPLDMADDITAPPAVARPVLVTETGCLSLTGSSQQPGVFTRRIALGPSLGQCCGGVVELRMEWVAAPDRAALAQRLAPPRWPLALFGGGHVGQAIVRAACALPFAVHWLDSREGVFPAGLPAWVCAEHSEPVQSAVADVAAGSAVLIMSFSHAEDLDVLAACLKRQRQQADLPFIGLIGSRTKWATFSHRLLERGFSAAELAQVVCPIGLPGIRGKQPAVIAASVVAQLLRHFTAAAPASSTSPPN